MRSGLFGMGSNRRSKRDLRRSNAEGWSLELALEHLGLTTMPMGDERLS